MTIKGVHVLVGVGAFFGIVIAVDAVFVIQAVATFPGEEVRNSYVLGLDYNREVERRVAQQKLGWRAEAGLQGQTLREFVVRLAESGQSPVTGLRVTADARMVGAQAEATPLILTERDPGEYVGAFPFSGAGRAEVSISARRPNADEVVFEAAKSLVLP